MKKHGFLVAVLLVIILPYVLFSKFETRHEVHRNSEKEMQKQDERNHTICVADGTSRKSMEFDDYITGVVLGEMPASFEMEALKAQAVAIRTYTLRSVMRNSKHPDADICSDSACCQAFTALDEYTGGSENLRKVMQAVADTAGQVITYQGNLIEATYFSCSGGKTEDAVAVWGTDVPYLQSVSSPGEEKSKYYETQRLLSFDQFRAGLGLPASCKITNDNILITHTDGDSVMTMTVGDDIFTGIQVRTLLSLPSASFSVSVTDTGVRITVKGNGHRVGMSQYGADAMALNGKTYDEILTYYYTGTELKTLSADQLNAIFDKEENL